MRFLSIVLVCAITFGGIGLVHGSNFKYQPGPITQGIANIPNSIAQGTLQGQQIAQNRQAMQNAQEIQEQNRQLFEQTQQLQKLKIQQLELQIEQMKAQNQQLQKEED